MQLPKTLLATTHTLCCSDKVCGRGILELFCGAGNFSVPLSQLEYTHIAAFEGQKKVIKDLNDLKIKNILATELNIYKFQAPKRMKKIAGIRNILFLDPPRSGYKNIQDLLKQFPEIDHIIYISCNIDSFARDIKAPLALGFKLLLR